MRKKFFITEYRRQMDLFFIITIKQQLVFSLVLLVSLDYNQKSGKWFYKLKMHTRMVVWEAIEANLSGAKIFGHQVPSYKTRVEGWTRTSRDLCWRDHCIWRQQKCHLTFRVSCTNHKSTRTREVSVEALIHFNAITDIHGKVLNTKTTLKVSFVD